MTQKEMRLQRIKNLNEKLSRIFGNTVISGEKCFLLKGGMVCRLDSIGGEYNAIVTEYADNIVMARRGIFGEDGELFYMDNMDEEQMLEAITTELEQL